MFALPEVKNNNLAFLSQNLCQDALENFFSCQRQRGGTCDHPNLIEYYQNTQALRVINSFCRGSVRSNCRGSMAAQCSQTQEIEEKLPKRRTARKQESKI